MNDDEELEVYLTDLLRNASRGSNDVAGMNRDMPVRYLDRDPGEPGPNGEVYLDQPPCPECKRGFLTRQIVREGMAEMCICTGGCGQRFWYER